MEATPMIQGRVTLSVILVTVLCTIFFACSNASPPRPDKAQQLSASAMPLHQDPPEVMPALANDQGSLWQDNSALGQMFINAKARHVGDILTVRIVETSSATNKASTKTVAPPPWTPGWISFSVWKATIRAIAPFSIPLVGPPAVSAAISTVRGAPPAAMHSQLI